MSKWDICLSINLREIVVYLHQQDWTAMQNHTPSTVARSRQNTFHREAMLSLSLFGHGSFCICQIMTEGFNFFQDDSKVSQSKTFVDPKLQLFE